MKRLFIYFLALTLALWCCIAHAQAQSYSWKGNGIAPNEHIHYLNIFVNIIYDVHPDTNNQFNNPNNYWPSVTDPALEGINNTAIPTYLLDWMDTVYVPGQMHGTFTRLYGESSFDTFQVTGDFMVVNLKESTVLDKGSFDFSHMTINKLNGFVLDLLDQTPSLSLFTHKPFSDFAYKNYLIRNISKSYGGLNPGDGRSNSGNTLQCVGSGDISTNPTGIVTHEISHNLFGTNNFHTSGGNHRDVGCTMSFSNIQGGYGLMGAANSGLVGCNGYERWRMHWKHPQSVDYIAARDTADTQSVVSDISRDDGNKTFLLRDFVTYGDAVRIKLPYKDSVTSSNQYVWLENHQVGLNSKLDFLQYSNTYDCRPQGAAGIYAYYQIGRDILSGTKGQVWDALDRDNLKVIPAEGYYDYVAIPDTYDFACVAYSQLEQAVVRGAANPLCGGHDQEKMLFPEDGDNVLYVTREQQPWRIVKDGQNNDSLPFLGDNHDAFTSHTRINMGTNPGTNNAVTCHSNNKNPSTIISAYNPEKDTRTIYLTGLGIEMTPVAGTGNFLVSIRWDDYDITNNCRWTGNIALKDTAILTMGNTVTLAQNRTVAQTTRDAETGLFAARTKWTCEAGSYLRQDNASTIRLTEGSSLVFESGSHFVQVFGSSVEVGAGCTLRFKENADVVLRGILKVDSGGVCYITDTVGMGATARIIVHPGGKLIVDGGTLTSASTGEMWQGIEVLGDRTKHQISSQQGVVELRNGAVVENARCGVKTGLAGDTVSFATAGGIVTAENATFRNCAKAVEYLAYIDTLTNGLVADNHGSFTNCTFTVNDNNLFATNNTSFLDHATLWGVKGVKFYGCTFTNATSSTYGRRHAIYAEEAGFTADVRCNGYTPTLPGDCGCPASYSDSCVFEGFSTAVEANTAGTPLAVTINRARFANNGTAVRINANNFATVTECDFDLSYAPNDPHDVYGLYLDNCTGYKVEGNAFYRDSYPNPIFEPDNRTGIYVKASGTSANSLYRNEFANLTKGVVVSGANGGLQIGCSGFSGNSYDISLLSGASVASPQGSLSAGADNVFVNTRVSSIQNAGTQKLRYYYSAGGNHAPYNQINVILDGGAAANTCASTLCGVFPPPPPIDLASFNSLIAALPSPQTTEPPTPSAGIASTESPSTDIATAIYHTAVRALMADSLLDLAALEQWHAAAQPIADPYSLTETRFAMGYDEDFAYITPTILSPAAAELPTATNELAAAEPPTNADGFYTDFHNLKRTLRGLGASTETVHATETVLAPSLQVNWYAMTPAQIAQLQNIAENGTGRASVMARGVLCFFFGICYDNDDMPAETRRATAKDGEEYMPVLTDDTITFSIAFRANTYVHDYDPYYLSALSCFPTSKSSDTVVYNNKRYRIFSGYSGGLEISYLREDTLTGRIFRYFPELDTEVVTCDMTLQPGDTFYFPDVMDLVWQMESDPHVHPWVYYDYMELEAKYAIVDSVTYVNGRKVIWFPMISSVYLPISFFSVDGYPSQMYPLCFIEGVGPTCGPFWGLAVDVNLGLLLCVHHNDSLIYMTDPVLGCEQYVVSVPDYPDVSMKLYPNPARNTLHVEFEGTDAPQGTLTVTNITGVVMLTRECHDPVTQLDVSGLSSGIYVVSFRNSKGVVVRKFVKL